MLDLASTLQGPLSDTTSGAGSGPPSVDSFSEVDPEVSKVPNSTSPSEADDDSMIDRHYNPAKGAAVLDSVDPEDINVDSDHPEEISPLVKKVKSHVRGGLREIPKPHHKDRIVNPVWNYYKKSIKMDSTGMIKTQHCYLSSHGWWSNLYLITFTS